MIRGSDGLEYEDLTARLLGEPAKTLRNGNIRAYRRYPHRYCEDAIRAYYEAFDEVSGGQPLGTSPLYHKAHVAGLRAAGLVGGFGGVGPRQPNSRSPG